MPSFAIHTLGCRANQADSERLREILLGAGFEEVDFTQPADVRVVNTCTVTSEADRKSIQLIRRGMRHGGRVVATGCAVAARGGLIKGERLPSAVLRLEPGRSDELLGLLGVQSCPNTRLVDGEVAQRRTRALLKVQDGCDQFCTFCIVPYVRGRSRSFPVETLCEQARAMERSGYREIVLTGIHLAVWGRELEPAQDLSSLLRRLLDATVEVRFRLSSIEPDCFPRDLFGLMKDSPRRVCPHLHLALQHASDRVLARMRRDYDLAHYRSLVEQFTREVPGACLTSDLMVGFPGETEEDFGILMDTVRRTPFFRLHIFPYSPRPGTAAARFPDQVPPEVRLSRRDRLLRLAEAKRVEFMRSCRGQERVVLVEGEGPAPGTMTGLTDNYLPVVLPGGPPLQGRLARVRLGRRRGEAVSATLVREEFLTGS
ncbi:MAG: MiaB/RimO family radical SAM methylthiotransferase [Candidatus Eremiobacterota bacterium]